MHVGCLPYRCGPCQGREEQRGQGRRPWTGTLETLVPDQVPQNLRLSQGLRFAPTQSPARFLRFNCIVSGHTEVPTWQLHACVAELYTCPQHGRLHEMELT